MDWEEPVRVDVLTSVEIRSPRPPAAVGSQVVFVAHFLRRRLPPPTRSSSSFRASRS